MDQLWILMFDVFEYTCTCTCSRLQLPHARRLSMIFAISCLQLLLSCSWSAWPSTLYSCSCSSPLLCFGINTFVFSCSPSVFIVCLIIHCFCLIVHSMCFSVSSCSLFLSSCLQYVFSVSSCSLFNVVVYISD